MILRAAKVETEQKKILKYTNAKGEVSWRGRKEKAGIYRRGSAPETNAALSVTPSALLLSSLLHSSFFSSFALYAAASVNDSSPHKTWKLELRMLNRYTSGINCRDGVALRGLKNRRHRTSGA